MFLCCFLRNKQVCLINSVLFCYDDDDDDDDDDYDYPPIDVIVVDYIFTKDQWGPTLALLEDHRLRLWLCGLNGRQVGRLLGYCTGRALAASLASAYMGVGDSQVYNRSCLRSVLLLGCGAARRYTCIIHRQVSQHAFCNVLWKRFNVHSTGCGKNVDYPCGFFAIFSNRLEFLSEILHIYYQFISRPTQLCQIAFYYL